MFKKLLSAALIALLPSLAFGQAATPISGLPAIGAPITGAEIFPIVQTGVTKRITMNQLFTAMTMAQVTASLGYTPLAPLSNLSDVSNVASARSNLGLVIGTNVQAWSANLDAFALKTAPSGVVVGTTDSQTLTNKTINGGTATALTGLAVRSTGSAFDLTFASAEVMTAGRTLTFNVGNVARTFTLGGNLTTVGGALTLTTGGATNVTLPTSGTLATLAGTETLLNKTLTSPAINTATIVGGTADSLVIGGSARSTALFTTLGANSTVSFSAGGSMTGTWSDLGSVTTVDINGGTVDGAIIGGSSAAAGTFTTLTATGAVALSPANAAVVLSPTGTGVVTINPATAGTLNNVVIGGSTPLAVTATVATANRFVPNSSTVATNGMYLSAANTLAFSTNSTVAGTIDSTQRLLMGGITAGAQQMAGVFVQAGTNSVGASGQYFGGTGSGQGYVWGRDNVTTGSFVIGSVANAAATSATNIFTLTSAGAATFASTVTTGGQINIGTAAFSGITNGIGVPTSNTFAIVTNSATALSIDSSQNGTFTGTASATRFIPTGSTIPTGVGMYASSATILGFATNGIRSFQIRSQGATDEAYVFTRSAPSGGNADLGVASSTLTNAGMFIYTLGAGTMLLGTNSGTTQLQLTHTASADRVLNVTGGVSGSSTLARISTTGGSYIQSDALAVGGTNANASGALLLNNATGAAGIQFNLTGTSASQLAGTTWNNSVGTTTANMWMTGDASAGVFRIQTAGTTSTIDFITGAVTIAGNTPSLRVGNSGGTTVNYLQVAGSTSTAEVNVQALGSDSNIPLRLSSKGTGALQLVTTGGAFNFYSNGAGSALQVNIPHVASADRYLILSGSNGGNPSIDTSAGSMQFKAGGGNTFNVNASAFNFGTTIAIPAGGTTGSGLTYTSATNFGVFFGSGAPTLSAAKGSLYLRSDGSTTNDRMYVNTNGSTTWTAVTTAS